jgi:AraC-like DNA-binding protein
MQKGMKEHSWKSPNGRWLRFLFMSYIIVLLIPLLTGIVVYSRANVIIRGELVKNSEMELAQVRAAMDIYFSEMENVARQIALIPQVGKFASYGELNPEKRYLLVELLKEYTAFNRILRVVDDYFVYFPSTGMFVTSTSVYEPQIFAAHMYRFPDIDFMLWNELSGKNPESGIFIPEKMTASRNGKAIYAVYRKSVKNSVTGDAVADIYVLINEEKIKRDMELYSAGIYLLNSRDQLILAQGTGNSPLSEDMLRRLPQDEGRSGLSFQIVEKQDYAISQETIGGIRYVIAQPMDALMKSSTEFLRIMVYSTVASLLAGLIAMAAFARFSYKPIRRITGMVAESPNMGALGGNKDEFRYIEQYVSAAENSLRLSKGLERQIPILQASLLSILLKGSIGADTRESLGIKLASCDLELPFDAFRAVLLRMDESPPESTAAYHLGIIKTRLEDLLQSESWSYARFYFVEAESNTLALIMNYDSGAASADSADLRLRAALEAFREIAPQSIGNSITICLGGVQKGLEGINQSYRQALWILNRKGIYAPDRILAYIGGKIEQSGYYYPLEAESMLIRLAKSGQSDEIARILKDIMRENFDTRMNRMPEIDAANYLFLDMAMTLAKLYNELGLQLKDIGKTDLFSVAEQCARPEQFLPIITEAYTLTCARINEGRANHKFEAIGKILEFIGKHYSENDFSQTTVAEKFNMSAAYLSTYFHKRTGEKMIDCINRMRLNSAKQMLAGTDKSIDEISRTVGFVNSISLTRVFKKNEFTTPGKYRESARENS